MTSPSAGAANRPRLLFLATTALLVGTAVHLDWHLARAHHHGALSFEMPCHWLIAVPFFALAPWYAARHWPGSFDRIAAIAIAVGLLLGQVVEPMWEFMAEGATAEWAFGIERRIAFVEFFTTGLVTYLVTRWIIRRRA